MTLDAERAALVSVLAYAGLRPGELRALRWGDVRERTILVQRGAGPGREGEDHEDARGANGATARAARGRPAGVASARKDFEDRCLAA